MIYILENYFRENLGNVLQACQIAAFLMNTHSKLQLYYHSLFYNKLNSMKQSFSNPSEVTKLHTLSNFLPAHGCNIFFFSILIYKNIIYASILQNALGCSKTITHPSDIVYCICRGYDHI